MCVVRQLVKQQHAKSGTREDGRESSENLIRNKSQSLNLYRPRVKFSEQSLEQLRNSTQHREGRSEYLQQPSNNVIECDSLSDAADEMALKSSSSDQARFETTLFIVINSRVDNFDRRQKLRSTWLNRPNLVQELCSPLSYDAHLNQTRGRLLIKTRVKRIEWVFALGRLAAADSAKSVNSRLKKEAQLYGDLLIFGMLDSYRNMTRKHLAIFKWLLEKDSASNEWLPNNQKILLKCDDDAQLDLNQMISRYALEMNFSHPSGSNRNFLMCARFNENSPVLRKFTRQTTKWSLSEYEWPYDTFPSYCSGLAYLASLELVERLYLIAPLVDEHLKPPLWIDDVYVTGVLLSTLELSSLKLVKVNPYYCYTAAQRSRRESLGVKCMAAEMRNQ